MDFELNEEQLMVRTMVKDFAEKEIAPTAREDDVNEKFPREIINKMAPLGLMGAPIPEEYGGMGLDWIAYGVMIEELGYQSQAVCSTVRAHISLGAQSILQWGSDEMKKKYVADMAAGKILSGFVTTEPNVGSDIASVECMAADDGDSWVLNGTKTWCTNGSQADYVIVVAQTDKSLKGRGLGAFLIPTDAKGYSAHAMHGKMGLRSSDSAEIALEDCRIPKENLLGKIGDGFKVAMSAFDRTRYCVAAGAVGALQMCIDASAKYVNDRVQFGKQLGTFQLVQQMIAQMRVECEAARLLVYRAGWLKNEKKPDTIATSMAKWYSTEAAFRGANNAIQILGSYGYTNEYPLERILRDVKACTILEGTSQMHTLIIGRDTTGLAAF
jgi:alkylation response protein AidB-like acyl-CoA dehydrogenase